MLPFVAFDAHAIPVLPSRAKVIVEDFSRFEPPSYAQPFVTANGTIIVPEEVRIYEGANFVLMDDSTPSNYDLWRIGE
jgi:hypothetical protein